jgi:hypothetical protein
MKIEQVIIRDLRALKSRDDTFVGPDGVFSAACLRGLNGCGKTTYLEALAQLWQWFRDCAARGKYLNPPPKSLLAAGGLVAALFSDLPGPRSKMWIARGRVDLLRAYSAEWPDTLIHVGEEGVTWEVESISWWGKAFARADLGEEAIPNIVFVESENKFVPDFQRRRNKVSRSGPAFVAVSRHNPTVIGSANFEVVMRTLFLARPERWKLLAKSFGSLRPGIRLLDRFDESGQRPLFMLKDGTLLTFDLLSAGERSVLINLCMVLRWLGPGGIVLIDEPELHQHLSLMRGGIAVTEALIEQELRGQLLVASHAPEVWDHFRMTGALIDLDPVGNDS